MRGRIVVLALAITPFVAPIAQGQQHWMRSHVTRHDTPLRSRHDDRNHRRDDNRRDKRNDKCVDSKHHDSWFWDWWSWWFGDNKKGDKKSSSKSGDKCDPQSPPDSTSTPPDTTTPPDTSTPPDTVPKGHTFIHGLVWSDNDQNGVQGAGEAGLSVGWTVQLTGPVNLTIHPNADGSFEFDQLVAGMYQVCVIPPAGWMQTPISGAPSCGADGSGLYGYTFVGLEVGSDVNYFGADFGFRQN